MTSEKQGIATLQRRIEKLEAAVFGNKTPNRPVKADARDDMFKGATGGVRLLVSEGFFSTARRFGDVTAALEAKGYLYSKQAFQEALNRLVKSRGPLVTLRKDGSKVYAERK